MCRGYYFQTYKYPYICYTTYLSWDSENNHEKSQRIVWAGKYGMCWESFGLKWHFSVKLTFLYWKCMCENILAINIIILVGHAIPEECTQIQYNFPLMLNAEQFLCHCHLYNHFSFCADSNEMIVWKSNIRLVKQCDNILYLVILCIYIHVKYNNLFIPYDIL